MARDEVVASLRAAGCVFAEEEAALLREDAPAGDVLAARVARRADGEPLEHVLGWAAFGGLRIPVGPGVFVPRRRTEFLVECARELAEPVARARVVVVVDLCCGAGALGAALAAGLPPGRVRLHAADVDPVAVRYARRSIAGYGGEAHVGDLFAALPAPLRGTVDVLAANTPYVPSGELGFLPAEARLHEPPHALDGGGDGLDVQRRVAAGAADWLAPGGHVLCEVTERQAPLAAHVFRAAGLSVEVRECEERAAHVVVGTRPAV